MFAHGTADVDCPFETVAARLRSPGCLNASACGVGEGPRWGGIHEEGVTDQRNAQDSFQVGQPRTRSASLLLPVSWEACAADDLVVAFEADLEVAPLVDDLTRLQLKASYQPPRASDMAALHHLAVTSVRAQLDRIVARVTRPTDV